MLKCIGLFGAYGMYAFFAVLYAEFVYKMGHETHSLELEAIRAQGHPLPADVQPG
jgi:hypothetical protein